MSKFLEGLSVRYAITISLGVLLAFPAVVSAGPGNPKPDINIVGPTKDPADIRDEGLKQQNEPACAIRPGDGDCIVCFFNDYRTVDNPGHGDAWIGQAESCDAANTWTSRIVPGHPLHPSPIDAQFAADPRVIAIPGMAIHGFIGGFRGQDRGVVAIQHWLENNKDDFDYYEPALDTIIVDTGTEGRFIDKPDFLFLMDEDSPQSTITLSTPMENSELGTIERTYPGGKLIAAYAVFTGSQSVKLLVKTSDDLGQTWANKTTKLTEGQNLISGITLTAVDGVLMAMWRQVLDTNDVDAMYYAVSTNDGKRWTKPELLTNICKFDQPSATLDTPPQVSFRTNDFPWLANDGKNIYAFYTERVGDCLTGTPRIVMQYTADGTGWSPARFVDNSAEATPGAQFMPSAFGARGKVQVAWYDTRREGVIVNNDQPFVADFFPDGSTRVNRKVDVYTARITDDETTDADGDGDSVDISEAVRVNRYRTVADVSNPEGPKYEIEASFANAMMYKSGSLAFLGDYMAVAGQEFRQKPNGDWESNYSPLPAPASNLTNFFIAYADHRNVRGDVLFGTPGGATNKPYTPPDNVAPEMAGSVEDDWSTEKPMLADTEVPTTSDRRSTEGVEDTFTDPNTVCVPEQDRTRDANIYGAVIRDELRFSTPVPSRPLSGILRAIPFTATNVSSAAKPYRVYISRQPGENPLWQRASFRQKPDRPPFVDVPDPVLVENFTIAPNSTVARTVFIVSDDIASTADVQIFDGVCAMNADANFPEDDVAFASNCNVLAEITLGGSGTAGALQQPEYQSLACAADPNCNNDVIVTELHNPLLENPLLENPLLENTQLEAPLLENPLLENPLLENFGFQNPLLENPLLENPLLENPLLENPLLENPLLENPLLENSALEAGVTYTDITAVIRNDGNVTTAYNFDATAAGLTTTAGGETVTQLILWKQYVYPSARDCNYVPEAYNQVLTTINQPNDLFETASVDEPFRGEASMALAPGERGYVTYRFFGTPTELQNVAIDQFTASAQATNCSEFDDEFGPPPGEEDDFYTCETDLADGRERILIELDTTGPVFTGLVEGQVIPVPALEANAPGGACVDPVASGIVMAMDEASDVEDISCFNAAGDAICALVGDDGLSVPVANLVADPGPSPMTCVATDTAGNSTSVNVFLEVLDTMDPFFTNVALNPTTINADANTGTAVATLEAGFAAADVDGVDANPAIACITDLGQVSGDTLAVRNHVVTCTVTDASGNTTSDNYTLAVADVTPPVISVTGDNPFTVELGSDYMEPGVAAADAVTPGIVVSSDAATAVDTSTVGSYTVTYMATDAAGNTSTATRVVLVEDTDPPDFGDIPIVITFEATSSGGAEISYDIPEATDETAVTVTCVPPSGTVLPVGMQTVTCTATDASGNTATAMFTVEVLDTTPPVLTVPDGITADMIGPDGAIVNYLDQVSATDLVDSSPDIDCTPASGTLFAIGKTTVSCTATDNAGNVASDTFEVAVGYGGGFGITPTKLTVKAGSSNPLSWGWQNSDGVTLDTSDDLQILQVYRDSCENGTLLGGKASDPGDSDFRVKSDLSWEFNWQADDFNEIPLAKGSYCLKVTSDLTGASLTSPLIRVR